MKNLNDNPKGRDARPIPDLVGVLPVPSTARSKWNEKLERPGHKDRHGRARLCPACPSGLCDAPAMKTAGVNRVRWRGLELAVLLWAVGLTAMAALASAASVDSKQAVFKLHAVSVFEAGLDNFLRGQMTFCETNPFPEVKSYPAFVSKQPLFGSVRFAAGNGQTNGGMQFYFAVDESQGTGKGYDRLYFDLNRDLDLRNDPVLLTHQQPVKRVVLNSTQYYPQVFFDPLSINFDLGAAGTRPVQIMPRLEVSTYGKVESKLVKFVRTQLYQGEITLGGERYQAWLGEDYRIRGRLDEPDTALLLKSVEPGGGWFNWWGADRLKAVHKFGGRLFTCSASPTGEELIVRPYQGDLGGFEIGPGGRAITNLSVSGSLEAQELAVPVGGDLTNGWPKVARRCQIPVGDYLPNIINVQFGRLGIGISYNYHSEGKPGDRGGRARVYGLRIRRDQPCVLDFSNKPDVMFASPAREQRFKPGDSVEVKAVLVDPKLDFMIRRLYGPGENGSKGRTRSLDPKVLITRADGEKVAEGVMPFG